MVPAIAHDDLARRRRQSYARSHDPKGAETSMSKLATIIPNRMDLRYAGEGEEFVNLQFHEKDDHVDVIFNRGQIPYLIEQLEKVGRKTEQAE
jgi:hypothetical protein